MVKKIALVVASTALAVLPTTAANARCQPVELAKPPTQACPKGGDLSDIVWRYKLKGEGTVEVYTIRVDLSQDGTTTEETREVNVDGVYRGHFRFSSSTLFGAEIKRLSDGKVLFHDWLPYTQPSKCN